MIVLQRKQATTGDQLDLVALDRTGVFVTTEGVLGRIVEVTPCNPRVMGVEDCQRVSRGFWQICARLPAGQSVQFYVEGIPEQLEMVQAVSRAEVDQQLARMSASRQRGLERLARAHEQSLRAHAADEAVVQFRAYVVIPYLPSKATSRVDWGTLVEARKGLPTAPLKRSLSDHRRAVRELDQLTDTIAGDLESLDLGARRIDGQEVAELLYRRFNPTSAATGTARRHSRLEMVGSLDELGDAKASIEYARQLKEKIAQSPMDNSDGRVMGVEQCLERDLYVSTPPDRTHFGWLLEAMEIDRPFVLTVHVHVLDRQKKRAKIKRQRTRAHGLVLGMQQRNRAPDVDLVEQIDEFEHVLGKARGSEGARLFKMSIYGTVRESGPDPDRDELMAAGNRMASAIGAETDAKATFLPWGQLDVWKSLLPLGRDVAGYISGLKREYADANVGDTVPLVGPSCGSPEGLVSFFSAGVRTLLKFNPWDPMFTNHLMVVNGQQGSGKTMWTVTTVARLLAYGVHATILDRSGHYEMLTRVVPDAAHLSIGGADASAVICPWDVPDCRRVSTEKRGFLLALHELELGKFTEDEKGVLSEGIRGTYAWCAEHAGQPRESHLKAELERMAQAAPQSSDVPIIESLIRRLRRFVGDGENAYLMDWPTTVPKDSPLVVYDTRHAGEHLAAVVMIVMERTIAEHERWAAERVLSGDPPRLFPGRMFVSDETWSVFENEIAGGMYHDLSRRARHLAYGLFLLLVTQYMSDLDNKHGRALLESTHMRLFFRQSKTELKGMRSALDLSENEVEQISQLRTAKGQYASAFWMNASRGRGVVRSVLDRGDVEYWLATSEPTRDVPVRDEMIRLMHEKMPDAPIDEVVWAALEELAAIGGAG